MTTSDSAFDLVVTGLLPMSWVRLFFIAHGFNFLLFSGSNLRLKSVGCTETLILGTHLLLPGFEELFVFSFCHQLIFLKSLFFLFSTSQLLHRAMCAPQFAHLDSPGQLFALSIVWSSSPHFWQTPFHLHLDLCVRICGIYDISWADLGSCIQRYLMAVRGYW